MTDVPDNITMEEILKEFRGRNACTVSGVPVGQPVKSFKSQQGEQFYDMTLEVLRTSHAIDKVPVTFSVANLKVVQEAIDNKVGLTVSGELRTKFVPDGKEPDGRDHMRLIISIFSRRLAISSEGQEDKNDCHFEGELGRIKELRNTPAGRTVIDFTLRVYARENTSKAYHIPCIAWGHLAEWIATLESGTKVIVDGRLQSREYTNQSGVTRTINELSAYELVVL